LTARSRIVKPIGKQQKQKLQNAMAKEYIMKRQILLASILSVTLLAGVAESRVASPPDAPKKFEDEQQGEAMPPERGMPPLMFGAHGENSLLRLTDDQEKKIAEILASEREKISPLLKKREEIRQRLMQTERAPDLDEPALRSIAGDLATTETELIVSHVKMNRQITATLTPEQREILMKHDRQKNFRPARPHPPKGAETWQ
jgi:Spy/CpxP family protein refolding chaperone